MRPWGCRLIASISSIALGAVRRWRHGGATRGRQAQGSCRPPLAGALRTPTTRSRLSASATILSICSRSILRMLDEERPLVGPRIARHRGTRCFHGPVAPSVAAGRSGCRSRPGAVCPGSGTGGRRSRARARPALHRLGDHGRRRASAAGTGSSKKTKDARPARSASAQAQREIEAAAALDAGSRIFPPAALVEIDHQNRQVSSGSSA